MHHDITVHRVVKSSKRAGQYIEPHIHAFFHFIYGLDGHLQVQVGAKRIQTKSGILVMVPPGVNVEPLVPENRPSSTTYWIASCAQ